MPRQKRYPDEEISAMSVRLPLSLKQQIETRAQINRRSLNQEIVWLLERVLTLLAPDADPGEGQ